MSANSVLNLLSQQGGRGPLLRVFGWPPRIAVAILILARRPFGVATANARDE